jgi:hypothetical protein
MLPFPEAESWSILTSFGTTATGWPQTLCGPIVAGVHLKR